MQNIADNSIDLIMTDPPYIREFKEQGGWVDLAIQAERVLKPSGFIVTYCGQKYLPDIFKAFDEQNYKISLGRIIQRN